MVNYIQGQITSLKTEVGLIYNVILVSDVQHGDSVIHTYVYLEIYVYIYVYTDVYTDTYVYILFQILSLIDY